MSKDVKKNKKDKMKRLTKNKVKTQVISLEKVEKLDVDKQVKYFEDIFEKIYSGEEVDSLRKYSLRTIKLTCDPKDNKIHLPYGVMVQKKKGNLIVKVYKNRTWFLLLLFITLMFLAILGASYSSIHYSIAKNLNKDLDNDGIPDINLDMNNDLKAEINIDIDWDDKPNLNIDYKGNRQKIFNVDRKGYGIADFNLTNQDLNNDGKCDINCDVNNDGWPDLNLNFNGNKRAEMYIDLDGDKRPDLNFDINRDMKCDLHCDTNKDNICDKWCLTTPELENMKPITGGTSTNLGNHELTLQAGELVLEYDDTNQVLVKDIYPDDQPFYNYKIPTKKFKVTNKSSLHVQYNLRWVVTLNDYISDNFKYKVTATNGGANLEWKTAPKQTVPLAVEVKIPPFTTQEYEVDFNLQGVGGKQNYDQGRTFSGYIEIYLDNEY